MPPSQRCPPRPLLLVSLVPFNCTLLPAVFTPVAAPVPNHSHPVCTRAVWSLHSLVAWASLCLGSLPLHGGNVPAIGKSVSILFYFIFYISRLNSWLVCFFFFFFFFFFSSPFISVSSSSPPPLLPLLLLFSFFLFLLLLLFYFFCVCVCVCVSVRMCVCV